MAVSKTADEGSIPSVRAIFIFFIFYWFLFGRIGDVSFIGATFKPNINVKNNYIMEIKGLFEKNGKIHYGIANYDIEVRNFVMSNIPSRNGYGFNADLFVNGQKIAKIVNSGDGGCSSVYGMNIGTFKNVRKVIFDNDKKFRSLECVVDELCCYE